MAPGTGATTHNHPYSFPARLKLTRTADFDAVFKEGQRSADQLFTLLYRPSGLQHARLGMTAPAKHLRTAVARNRIRRLIRESFRHAEQSLTGLDIVVLVKAQAGKASNPQVFTSLSSHWNRLQRAAVRA